MFTTMTGINRMPSGPDLAVNGPSVTKITTLVYPYQALEN